jgi:hypothetical protein
VRITSGFGGGEFTKTLSKVCTCQKLKFAFLLLEYCKIRECYAVANAFTIRNMYSLLLYMKCNSRKINRPTKNMRKLVTLVHSKLFLTKMQVKFSIFFHFAVIFSQHQVCVKRRKEDTCFAAQIESRISAPFFASKTV